MEQRKWQAAVDYLKEKYDVNMDAGMLALHVSEIINHSGHCTWSDGTWDLWLRKRVDELGAWPALVGEAVLTDITTAVLHVFFPFLEETLEMQERLSHDTSRIASAVARSKISKTNEVIHPIDSVAQRVAPER